MQEVDLERIIDDAYMDTRRIIEFGRHLSKQSDGILRPKPHQIVRIHEAVRNGKKRMLCADTTSAGKTLTAVADKGLLDEDFKEKKGRKAKALVIAPNQAVDSAWTNTEINKYTGAMQLPKQTSIKIERGNLDSLAQYDFILVNYDKLSIEDSEAKVNKYLRAIVDVLPLVDMVIVDECHNLKNIQSNRSRAFRQIVEKTKGKYFLMLSASPIPNRLEDAGFLLYMLDPVRYKHYADNPFDYAADRYSIMNAMNSGAWFTFSREDVKALFGLPELYFGDESLGIESAHRFELSEEAAIRYFREWKRDAGGISKIAKLSRILLESEFDEIIRLCNLIKEKDPEAQAAVYSFYKEGFTEELAARLNAKFGSRSAGTITGDEKDMGKRMAMANRFRKGKVDFLVNTIKTVSESISLITHDRPSYLIFAEPPIVPANYDQAIGRLYRISQSAPVTILEMIPTSAILNEWMAAEKERRIVEEGIRFRKSWRPGTIFEDKYRMRQEKNELLYRVLNALNIEDLIEIANVSEGGDDEAHGYITIPPKPEREETTNEKFNEGLKKVRKCIGRPLEELVNSNDSTYLVDSYSRKDWDTTSSADTNKAIAKIIYTLREETGRPLKDILDWGCGTACLARTMKEKVHNLDAMSEMIEVGKDKCEELGIYDGKVDDYFHIANAREMSCFKDKTFDVIVSSYSLQYNAQGWEHRRDMEEIIAETNRILKDNGYGIFALANQATSASDIKAITEELLPMYGFEVILSDYVTGHAIREETGRENKVFQGVHLIVYQKKEDKKGLQGEDTKIFIYSPYKQIGIGGVREKEMLRQENRGYKRNKNPATSFKTKEKVLLEDALRKGIGNK